jgi:hypothetical protein
LEKFVVENWGKIITIIGIVVAGLLGGLRKLGWLNLGNKPQEWDGLERRECAQHPALNQKVCSLFAKLEDLDKKLDSVAEKLQYVLGALEDRWRRQDNNH